MQSNHSRRNQIISVACIFICFLLIFELLYWWQVEHVQVNGIREDSEEALVIIESIENARIILLSESTVKTQIEQQVPKLIVKQVQTDILSRNIKVTVETRSDSMCIDALNGRVFTDVSGLIYTLPNEKECLILYNDYLYEGDFISDSRLQSALWYADMLGSAMNVNEKITSTMDGTEIVFPVVEKYEDAENTVNLLQKVLQKYTIEGKRIERLDLRFSDPVIQFK